MAVIGLQSSIWSNRFKTGVLLVLFPVLVLGIVYLVMFGLQIYGALEGTVALPPGAAANAALEESLNIFTFLGPAILVWALVSFLFHRQMIFAFSGARPLTRKENPEIYNIVENLCISRGIPTPNIGILDDESLNAFAVGWNPKSAWIVFSQGIVNKLTREEIEAVAAHELTHILNKDGLLLVTIIVYIGAIAAIGELLFRMSSGKRDKDGMPALMVVGIVLLVLGYLVLPLVQLAVSRKREYLADAGSAQLTKNPEALISALSAIRQDSTIESIEKDSISSLCISNPFPASSGIMGFVHEFFSTHPSMDDRIELLKKY